MICQPCQGASNVVIRECGLGMSCMVEGVPRVSLGASCALIRALVTNSCGFGEWFIHYDVLAGDLGRRECVFIPIQRLS